MTWQPRQLESRTSRRPRSTKPSSGVSGRWAGAGTFSLVKERTAVTRASASSDVKWNLGIRRRSQGSFSLPRSKMRGSMNFWWSQAGSVWGSRACSEPKSSRSTSFDPCSESSVPIGIVVSKPGIMWQPKHPERKTVRSPR